MKSGSCRLISIEKNEQRYVNKLIFLHFFIWLVPEWMAGKMDNVTKKTKKTFKSWGNACLNIVQYGGRELLPAPLTIFDFSNSLLCTISW